LFRNHPDLIEHDGPDDAPVLVLSNSIGSTSAMWDPQMGPLSERFRVVRYETRGHASAPVPDGPYAIDHVGQDALALLDRLGVERAHFAGLSLGGMTGMWLGVNAPVRIDRLILMCTSPKMGPKQMWVDRAKAVRAEGTEAIVDATLERWLADPEALVPGTTMTFPGIKDPGRRADLVSYLRAVSDGHAPQAAAGRMSPRRLDLKTAPPEGRVTAVSHCGDTYAITTADGQTQKIWEFNLRFKTDSSQLGPAPGKPALLRAGMQGDRASVVFSSPAEISRFIEARC